MYLAILGRQPEISLAELKAQFGAQNVRRVSEAVAEFSSEAVPELARFGGSLKFGEKIGVSPVQYLLGLPEGKITLGVSDYTAHPTTKRATAEALRLKQILKRHERSVRVVPLARGATAISTATAHHNRLGEKPLRVELMMAPAGRWFASLGVQNITAYARRDQARPFRDARVGMLPPKLAQILINLAGPLKRGARILDPFCGTGVVLQEAMLMGYSVYGTDADKRMVEYARKNLTWLAETEKLLPTAEIPLSADASARPVVTEARRSDSAELPSGRLEAAFSASPALRSKEALSAAGSNFSVSVGDATKFTWEQPVDAVVFEGYLGPPMSQVPADIKIKSVMVDLYSLYYHTLRNLSSQLSAGTPVVMAVPAWLRADGGYMRLFSKKMVDEVEEMGYNVSKNFGSDLLYARAGQVVAREIIILRKK